MKSYREIAQRAQDLANQAQHQYLIYRTDGGGWVTVRADSLESVSGWTLVTKVDPEEAHD